MMPAINDVFDVFEELNDDKPTIHQKRHRPHAKSYGNLKQPRQNKGVRKLQKVSYPDDGMNSVSCSKHVHVFDIFDELTAEKHDFDTSNEISYKHHCRSISHGNLKSERQRRYKKHKKSIKLPKLSCESEEIDTYDAFINNVLLR